jgi:DNA-3-methyladenine glycosylase II
MIEGRNLNDSQLQKIMEALPPPVIHSSHDIFHDLMSCIIEQQIHYRSSKRIFSKALEKAGITVLSPDNFHLFEKHALADLKLSMNKYETMMGLMDYSKNNSMDFNSMKDEDIHAELSKMKGIGRWSIDMILLYTLQRPNIFPYDDYHLKRIMTEVYKLNPRHKLKQQMLEIAEKWGDHKSLAVLYLLEWKKGKQSEKNLLIR